MQPDLVVTISKFYGNNVGFSWSSQRFNYHRGEMEAAHSGQCPDNHKLILGSILEKHVADVLDSKTKVKLTTIKSLEIIDDKNTDDGLSVSLAPINEFVALDLQSQYNDFKRKHVTKVPVLRFDDREDSLLAHPFPHEVV